MADIMSKFWAEYGEDIRAQVDADKSAWVGLRAAETQPAPTLVDLQPVDMHGAVNANVHGGMLWLKAVVAAPTTMEQRTFDLEYMYTEDDGRVTVTLCKQAG